MRKTVTFVNISNWVLIKRILIIWKSIINLSTKISYDYISRYQHTIIFFMKHVDCNHQSISFDKFTIQRLSSTNYILTLHNINELERILYINWWFSNAAPAWTTTLIYLDKTNKQYQESFPWIIPPIQYATSLTVMIYVRPITLP